jgi:hypothetical protein
LSGHYWQRQTYKYMSVVLTALLIPLDAFPCYKIEVTKQLIL